MTERSQWFIRITRDQVDSAVHYQTNLQKPANAQCDPEIYIDGFVVPKIEQMNSFLGTSQNKMIADLYRDYGRDFIHYVKGAFCIVILGTERLEIYTDRHSIGKFFVYDDGKECYISNSLARISSEYALNTDPLGVAAYALLNHFFHGMTLFEHLTASTAASVLELKDKAISRGQYWTPKELFTRTLDKSLNLQKFAGKWQSIIRGYVDYLSPEHISLTLTGGNDSRMVLAGLMAQKIDFHAFTYGNPDSLDAIIARTICEKAGLRHDVHHVSNPTQSWFAQQAEALVVLGDSLVNIHRAHRLDAAQKEIQYSPEPNMIFTGLVGGEYLKKPINNDMVIPEIFFLFRAKRSKDKIIAAIKEKLGSKAFNIDKIDMNRLYDYLKDIASLGAGITDNQWMFLFTYLFYGCSHHLQDSLIYRRVFSYTVNPFMDIDVLEHLATDPSWYVNKDKMPYNRFFHSELIVGVTDYLAPKLSWIPYGKKGMYSARDLLGNKMSYLIKRISGRISRKNKHYPPSFPMGSWLYDFCNIKLNNPSPFMSDFYDVRHLKSKCIELRYSKTEADWHSITTPINLSMISETYGKA